MTATAETNLLYRGFIIGLKIHKTKSGSTSVTVTSKGFRPELKNMTFRHYEDEEIDSITLRNGEELQYVSNTGTSVSYSDPRIEHDGPQVYYDPEYTFWEKIIRRFTDYTKQGEPKPEYECPETPLEEKIRVTLEYVQSQIDDSLDTEPVRIDENAINAVIKTEPVDQISELETDNSSLNDSTKFNSRQTPPSKIAESLS